MNILVVDADSLVLRNNEQAIIEAVPDASIKSFCSPEAALEYARMKRVDVAFLGIEMTGMNGLALAKHLKNENPEVNIIFVTSHNSFANEAFALRASGYVLKPLTSERAAAELEHLRNPVMDVKKEVRIQCFGNFEIFVGGMPLVFNRPKSKEILAYLVDRKGAAINKKELARILWEGEEYTRSIQSHLHILVTDLMNILREAGVKDVVIKQRSTFALNVSRVVCDYYLYEKGDQAAINSYRGEYMANYAWAQGTARLLSAKRTV